MPDLYPFQRKGVRFLTENRRAYLADQMGLGKTVQAITAARRENVKRPCIICPASAVPNWEREWETWMGPEIPQVLSYAMLVRHGADVDPDLVVLDEAHYAKSPSAKRTRAALKLARQAVLDGGRTWLLSGTPMPNHPGELWPAVRALWPEIAKKHDCHTYQQWLRRWCKLRPTQWGWKPYAVKDGAVLREDLERIMLRRTLDEVGLELPPLRVELSRLPKTKAAEKKLAEYEDMEANEEAYVSTLRRLLGIAKVKPVANQIIRELDDGAYQQIVVLYYHTEVGKRFNERLQAAGYSVAGFDGSTGGAARQSAIDAFQEGEARVFCAQQTAAGIAINLTAANEIVLVEPSWTPDDNDQAIHRIHRIGQDNPCRARIFCLSGTLDEAVMGVIRRKMKMKREVLG